MEGEVMEAPELPELLEKPPSDFWELHRQLANCYMADIARVGGERPAEKEMSAQFSMRSLPQKSPRASTEPSKYSMLEAESLTLTGPTRRDSRRQTLKDRRDKSMKTLRSAQGFVGPEGCDASSSILELIPFECWGDPKTKVQPKWTRGRTKDNLTFTNKSAPKPTELGSSAEEQRERFMYVFHPGGSFRTAWNLSMALCVLYDLMVIPLYAYDLPPSLVLEIFDWFIQIFWNVDLMVSFLTGYYDEGALIFSIPKIALHYAKTWLLFDLSLLSMDWAFRIMEWSNDGGLESIMWSRSLRMLRFLRLMRMLRMVKLRHINEVFQEFFHSQAATLYYSLFSSLIHLCILNHLIACAWFAVSHVNSRNWVTELGIENSAVEYQYLTCLNWAFAQLGVGSSPALATNVPEMAYCIVIAFRSLITSSTLISTVSNLMAGLSKIKEDENTEFRLLRCYLAQNDIPPELGQKITQFLQYQYTLRQEARSADMEVPLLELLSPQLQGELQFARSESNLCKLQVLHDLLEMADRQVLHILHRLAQDAVKNYIVASADVIFLAGNHAPSAFLKLSGDLTYSNEDSDEADETINSEFWVAEVALWTQWHYLGDLVSSDVSRVASLDVQGFCHALTMSWQTQRAASRYAAQFLAKMSASGKNWTDTFVLPRDEAIKGKIHVGGIEKRGYRWFPCCPWKKSRKVQDDFSSVGPSRTDGDLLS